MLWCIIVGQVYWFIRTRHIICNGSIDEFIVGWWFGLVLVNAQIMEDGAGNYDLLDGLRSTQTHAISQYWEASFPDTVLSFDNITGGNELPIILANYGIALLIGGSSSKRRRQILRIGVAAIANQDIRPEIISFEALAYSRIHEDRLVVRRSWPSRHYIEDFQFGVRDGLDVQTEVSFTVAIDLAEPPAK